MNMPFPRLSSKISPIVLALTLAFPLAGNTATAAGKAASKPTHEQLQSEIDQLKAQVAELRKMVMEKAATPAPVIVQAPPAPPPKPSVDVAEFNRIRVKVEALEDTQEESGFKGMKVSGFIDPTYMFNQRTGRGAFQFMNSLNGTINDQTTDIYSYTTSNLGGATLKFEKDFGNGTMLVSMRPRKDITGGDIFDAAVLNIPLSNGLTLTAGKVQSFNGYELTDAPLNKVITHNLLYDFGGPVYMTGAGLKFDFGGMSWQTMVGNLNGHHDLPGSQNSGFHWRGDYYIGEFAGIAINGMHGHLFGQKYNYWDIDYYYAQGDYTFNAQIEGSKHKNSAFNGGDSSHFGASALAALKLTPDWEAVVRADYYDNHKNGGFGPAFFWGADDGTQGPAVGCPDDGTGLAFATSCGDYRNGFGPGAIFNGVSGLWELGDVNRGSKRTALTFGLNYTLSDNAFLKFELRHDRSDLFSFYDRETGSYKKSNMTFGVQTVVSF